MTEFVSKKIGEKRESAGEIIKRAREIQQLSLTQASRLTGIRADYLDAIEKDDLHRLPEGLYRKNYIKKYAQFLNVEKHVLPEIEGQFSERAEEDPFIKKVVTKDKMMVFPRIVRNLAILLVFLAFFAYLIFYLRNILSAPRLELTYPDRNLTTQEEAIVIQGISSPLAEIRINGETVLADDSGKFSKEISLKQGLNNIMVSAKKKHSRENTESRQILLQ